MRTDEARVRTECLREEREVSRTQEMCRSELSRAQGVQREPMYSSIRTDGYLEGAGLIIGSLQKMYPMRMTACSWWLLR